MASVESTRFSSADISIIVHATENKDKILQSFYKLFSISADRFSPTESLGHWGNKIVFLTANLGSSEANTLASKIISYLNSFDKSYLSTVYSKFIDEKGNLYIRLDKQRICQGRISLSNIDSIRFRFRSIKRFIPTKKEASNHRGLRNSRE